MADIISQLTGKPIAARDMSLAQKILGISEYSRPNLVEKLRVLELQLNDNRVWTWLDVYQGDGAVLTFATGTAGTTKGDITYSLPPIFTGANEGDTLPAIIFHRNGGSNKTYIVDEDSHVRLKIDDAAQATLIVEGTPYLMSDSSPHFDDVTRLFVRYLAFQLEGHKRRGELDGGGSSGMEIMLESSMTEEESETGAVRLLVAWMDEEEHRSVDGQMALGYFLRSAASNAIVLRSLTSASPYVEVSLSQRQVIARMPGANQDGTREISVASWDDRNVGNDVQPDRLNFLVTFSSVSDDRMVPAIPHDRLSTSTAINRVNQRAFLFAWRCEMQKHFGLAPKSPLLALAEAQRVFTDE